MSVTVFRATLNMRVSAENSNRRFATEERSPGTHLKEDYADPRAGLEVVAMRKIPAGNRAPVD